MKHIRYMSTNKTVCESPGTLGYDVVMIDYGEGESCDLCLGLIMGHNMRSRQRSYDLLVKTPQVVHTEPEMSGRELFLAVLFTSVFWIAFFLVFMWVMF